MRSVSVVIPTYRTPISGLQRLVASLDRQTMPSEDFEVIFVDDGSPDDTHARLLAVQRSRPNVRVERIENSGWPSKPRNVGVELAEGAYIAFADHDDEFYPDALRAAHALAVANDADVVVGKESRTETPSWGLGRFQRDEPQAIGNRDRHPLIPMNPHKLYRRRLLLEHGIRFPEGGRVMWEDIFFNVEVARHAAVISTLSSTPYYHWVNTAGSGSTTFVKSRADYWGGLHRVCEAIQTVLAGDEHRLQREQLLYHQYAQRILGAFDTKFLTRDARDRAVIFEGARALQEHFGFERFDVELSRSQLLRARVLRHGDLSLMERACREDVRTPGTGRASALRWVNGVLRVEADVEWTDGSGRLSTIERTGACLRKIVSPEVRAIAGDDPLDVTDEVAAAHVGFVVHSRRSSVAWSIPADFQLQVEDTDGGAVRVHATAAGEIDPDHAAMGRALTPATPWKVQVRAEIGSAHAQRGLKSDVPATISMRPDRLDFAFSSGGVASLVVGDPDLAVRHLQPAGARTIDGGLLEVVLHGSHDGTGTLDVVVGRGRRGLRVVPFEGMPAQLRVEAGLATLRFAATASTIHVRIGDRADGGRRWWTIIVRSGRARLVPGRAAGVSRGRRASESLRQRLRLTVNRTRRVVRRFAKRLPGRG